MPASVYSVAKELIDISERIMFVVTADEIWRSNIEINKKFAGKCIKNIPLDSSIWLNWCAGNSSILNYFWSSSTAAMGESLVAGYTPKPLIHPLWPPLALYSVWETWVPLWSSTKTKTAFKFLAVTYLPKCKTGGLLKPLIKIKTSWATSCLICPRGHMENANFLEQIQGNSIY